MSVSLASSVAFADVAANPNNACYLATAPGSLAVTGADGAPSILLAGIAIVAGVIFVVVARQRQRATYAAAVSQHLAAIDVDSAPYVRDDAVFLADDGRVVRPGGAVAVAVVAALLVAAGIVLGWGVSSAHAADTAPAAGSAEISNPCELFSFDVGIDGTTVAISADGTTVQRLTLRNISNVPIAVQLDALVTDDPTGLAQFVVVDAGCGCATSPMLGGLFSSSSVKGSTARIAPFETVVIEIRMRTIPEITNDYQGATLRYDLVVYAEQVAA